MDPHTHLLNTALAAARRGWHVFPLRPGSKIPAGHNTADCPGTGRCSNGHRTWEQRATTDPRKIVAAWSTAPYNIGLATGPSGLCVIDLDVLKPGETEIDIPEKWRDIGVRSGEDVLAAVAEHAGQPVPGDTLTVRTTSGGLHLYYTAPDCMELRNTGGDQGRGLGWKIDTRAWGGYVLAPGSLIDDRPYELLYDGAPAPLPDWLVTALTPAPLPPAPVVPIRPATGRRSRYLEAAIRAEAAKVHVAPKGQRNACLYVAAVALGQLVAGGALSEQEHEAVLMTAAGRHIGCGAYSAAQARRTIASGLKDGAKRPRQIA
jgi:Bifunctional DNA primase/polymerase, N-terminal